MLGNSNEITIENDNGCGLSNMGLEYKARFKSDVWGLNLKLFSLVFQIPAEKALWLGFWGPITSSQGVWKPRA